MRDEDPEGGGKFQGLMTGCAIALVVVALAIGLFFGVCSMLLRR